MKISIITTLYRSASHVEEFYQRIGETVSKITDDYEIIFVNDGSPDNSLEITVSLHKKDSRVKVIDLSRNFGHHRAIMTGLGYAKGEYVFLIDSDLEEPPELLGNFWEELHQDDDIDVIYGVQESRKGNLFEKWTGKIFYKLYNLLSDEAKVTENLSTVRLMRARYVQSLIQFKDKELYIGPIWNLAGYKQKLYYFEKNYNRKTSYSFLMKYHLFVSLIISFSTKPLFFVFYTGVTITMLSMIYITYIAINRLLYSTVISGWSSLIVSIWFLGGIIILFIGILSLYISKIFKETKHRPSVIIKNLYE